MVYYFGEGMVIFINFAYRTGKERMDEKIFND